MPRGSYVWRGFCPRGFCPRGFCPEGVLSAHPGSVLLQGYNQGFMQDKIIASHTCFGGHMDVNC